MPDRCKPGQRLPCRLFMLFYQPQECQATRLHKYLWECHQSTVGRGCSLPVQYSTCRSPAAFRSQSGRDTAAHCGSTRVLCVGLHIATSNQVNWVLSVVELTKSTGPLQDRGQCMYAKYIQVTCKWQTDLYMQASALQSFSHSFIVLRIVAKAW